MQQILFTSPCQPDVLRLCRESRADRIFLLTDETTHRLCRPLLASCLDELGVTDIVIPPTDEHKHIGTLQQVWHALSQGGASRHSMLVNLGGGMVTDLGGFAAATFKRGIRFLHVPTTLLSMVDAAVGGKTGINFEGLKNEIGAFAESDAVCIDTAFLQTLDSENLRSGYAEMLKHALLSDEAMWVEHVAFDLAQPNYAALQHMVRQSIEVKRRIVQEDPHEHGLRKALNLGHTVGHAFESLALERHTPVLHGYAVAWGLVCELYLSAALTGFPTTQMRQTVAFIRHTYGPFAFSCKDYDALHALMLHDKKNVSGTIRFTLLGGIGQVQLDQQVPRTLLDEAFDFLREG